MNYPGGVKLKKDNTKEPIIYGNRGMSLESDINITNDYYREKDICVVYKKPTPVKVTKVDYNNKVRIKEGVFEAPSTTDYNGTWGKYYIDFEAKETTNKTSFPLHNIHKHQIAHIRKIIKQDAIVFLIVSFVNLNETYLLLGEDFINYIDNNIRSSIPYDYFKEKGYLLEYGYSPRLDYIKVIERIYGGKNGK